MSVSLKKSNNFSFFMLSSVFFAAIIFLSGCAPLRMVKHKIDNYFSPDPLHACDCFPPEISQMQANSITSTSATINFTCEKVGSSINPTPINYGGTGQIKYSTLSSDLTGSGGILVPNVDYTTLPMLQYNSIPLTGLQPNTVYYYYPISHAKTSETVWYTTVVRMAVGVQAAGTKTIQSFTTLGGTTYSISGYVKNGSGTAIQGVTMTLSGSAAGTYSTTSAGYYEFTGLAAGNYGVTASRTDYSFSPSSRTYTSLSASQINQDYTATLVAFSIGGTVTAGGSALGSVTMALTGSASANTTTNSSGIYMFSSLAAGSYTVTPSRTNYTFTPVNRSYTLSSNQAAQNYTATLVTYSISGTVQKDGAALSGVTMSLSGDASTTATTDASGNYSFSGLVAGNYGVTAARTGYTFSPSSRTYTSLSSNQTGQNYAATILTYNLNGYVRASGTGLEGVTLTVTGSSNTSTKTNSSGYYAFTALPYGTYTLTPSSSGYTFNPSNMGYNPLSANQSNQNFEGTATSADTLTYEINGYVLDPSSNAVSAASVVLSGANSGTYITGISGYYEFTGLATGYYQTSASKTGSTVLPANRTYSLLVSSQANQNFFATPIPVAHYSLSGYVRDNSATGINGVIMTLTGAATSYAAVTNSSGYYVFTSIIEDTYELMPSRTGFVFDPAARDYTPLSSNQSGQNFTGSDNAVIISDVEVAEPGNNTVMISWRTNVAATSQVEFGTSELYGRITSEYPETTVLHYVRLYDLAPDTVYHYRVISKVSGGLPNYSGDYSFSTNNTQGKIIESEKVANCPNPCKTRTSFYLTTREPVDSVEISVYSLSGKRVKLIEKSGSELVSGTNSIAWDLTDDSGNKVGNGLYVYQMKVRKGFLEEKIKKANLMVIK